MFKLFKKKAKDIEFFAPVTGEFVPLSEVSDPVFSQKLMGEGFGVKPSTQEIYAPIAGTITTVFKTKHALGIKTQDGLEILVHIGIDTVDLKGAPFEILVAEGQEVTSATKLATVDFEQIKAAQKDEVVLVLITNSAEKVQNFEAKATGKVTQGQAVSCAKLK